MKHIITIILIVCSLSTVILLHSCISNRPTERIEFMAPDSYPEGIAFDSVRQQYYVSSARTGSIGRVSLAGVYSLLHADTGLKSTYGMKVHPNGKELYVCAGDANYSKYTAPDTREKMARLVVIDLSSGNRTKDIDLSKLLPGKHFPNDLTFDMEGNCYITDSYAHAIYKVTPDGKPSVLVQDPLFETQGIGVNGIAWHPEGFLLVDNSNTGGLYKIVITSPAKVSRIRINQFFLGADGLLLKDLNDLI
ncbi:MAG TPA: hypothetical protein VM488_12555, partial [Pseudobacter sp.]|nr:hypothetical protein [Pseudobacter sp.]